MKKAYTSPIVAKILLETSTKDGLANVSSLLKQMMPEIKRKRPSNFLPKFVKQTYNSTRIYLDKLLTVLIVIC